MDIETDTSSGLDEIEGGSSWRGYDPDLHIASAIKIDERLFLMECLTKPDLRYIICPQKYKLVATEIKKMEIDPLLIDIESEKYYPTLFNTYPTRLSSNQAASDKILNRSINLSKLLTRSNIELLEKNTGVLFSELKDRYAKLSYSPRILYLHRLRSMWLQIRNSMFRKQQINDFTILDVIVDKTNYPLLISLTSIFCLVIIDEKVAIFDYNQVMMIHDTITSRYLATLCCEVFEKLNYTQIPSPSLLMEVYGWGDEIIQMLGNEGYNIIKNLEPICTGVVLDTHDTMSISKRFFQELVNNQDSEYGKEKLKSLYNLLKDNTQNVCQVIEIFGCYRHWGHPTVDEDKGCKTMRDHTRKETELDKETIKIITGAWNRFFILNFISKNRRWPRCYVHSNPDSVINNLINNTVLTLDEYTNQISLLDWSEIVFEQEFEFDYYPDFTQLLSDKSLSPYLLNFARVYNREMHNVKFAGRMKEHRRVLLEILSRKEIDLKVILDRIQNRDIPDDWLTVGLHSKERELKIGSRMFAMLVLEMRLYFCATESNIAQNIFKYMPCQTMTWSEADLMKHLHEISKMDVDSGVIPVTFSIDYEKWNNMWRDQVVKPIFGNIDRLLGTPGLIDFTHEFFRSCFFYLSSHLHPPDYLRRTDNERRRDTNMIKPQDSFKESETTWASQEGGCEGLRQKGWTAVIGGSLLAAEYSTGVKSIITGQGDNQVIVAFFKMRADCSNLTEYMTLYGHLLEEDIQNYLDFLKTMSGKIGMNIKLEETWISQHLFNYGKEILVDGIFTSGILKKLCRTYLTVSDTYPSIADRIAAIHTTAHSTCGKSVDTIFPYFIAVQEELALLLIEQADSITMGREMSHLLKKSRQTLTDEFLLFITILSKDFGGYPIMPFTEYLYRGHPDPVTSYLVWLKHLARSIPIAEKLWKWIFSMEGRSINKFDYSAIIQDPVCLNFKKPVNGVNVIKNYLESALRRVNKNKELSILMAHNVRNKRSKKGNSIMEYLSYTEPFSPRVLNSIFSDSPEGACLDFVSTFVDMRTIKTALTSEETYVLRRELKQCDINWFNFIIQLYIKVRMQTFKSEYNTMCRKLKVTDREVMTYCTTELAQLLRNLSWEREIYHVTVPHPLEQFKIFIDLPPEVKSTYEQQNTDINKDKEYILYIYTPPTKYLIRDRVGFSRGNIPPYYGSHTQVKISSKLLNIQKTDRSIKAAQSLFRVKTWVCEEESKFGEFLSSLIKTRTDMDEDTLASSTGTCLGGSVAHRFDDKITKHFARSNIRPNAYSSFYISSDEMGCYTIGLENYTVFFQGAFMCGLSVLTHVMDNCLVDNSVAHVAKQMVHCKKCFKKLDEKYFQNDAEPPNLAGYKDSKILFSSTSDITDKIDWRNSACVKLLTPSNGDNLLLVRRATAAGYAILGIASTQSAPLVHSPYNSPVTFSQTNIISLASILQIGPLQIFRKFGHLWFLDNLPEILRLHIQSSISLPIVVKTLLLRSPKTFWSPLKSLLLHREVLNIVLQETGYLPGSSTAFTGTRSLDIMISHIVSFILIEDLSEDQITIPLYAMTTGINAQRVMRIWTHLLCFDGGKGNPQLTRRLCFLLSNICRDVTTDNNVDIPKFITLYTALRSKQPELPDIFTTHPLYLSRIGAEPWLKMKNQAMYRPTRDLLKITPRQSPYIIRMINCLKETYLMKFKYHITATRKFVAPKFEDIKRDSPIMKTQLISGYTEHLLKTTGAYSSSHYKYTSLLLQMGIQNVKTAVCLGEGNGGVSRLLLTLYNCNKIYFNTLLDITTFPPHRATSFYPPELLCYKHLDRVKGINLCITHGGDITNESYRTQFINSYQSDVIDLVTCDIESAGFTSIDQQRIIIQNCIDIINHCKGNPYFIIKVYIQQEDSLNIFTNQLLSLTDRVEILCPLISSQKAQEFFITGKKKFISNFIFNPVKWLDWGADFSYDPVCVNRELAHTDESLILEQVSMSDIEKVNKVYKKLGYPDSLPFALEQLTGDFLPVDLFLKNPLTVCAETIESIHHLAITRLISYGMLNKQMHIPSRFATRYSEIKGENTDIRNLLTFIHNIKLLIIYIKLGYITEEHFYEEEHVIYDGDIVYKYVVSYEPWMRRFGRCWYKICGILPFRLEVDIGKLRRRQERARRGIRQFRYQQSTQSRIRRFIR